MSNRGQENIPKSKIILLILKVLVKISNLFNFKNIIINTEARRFDPESPKQLLDLFKLMNRKKIEIKIKFIRKKR